MVCEESGSYELESKIVILLDGNYKAIDKFPSHPFPYSTMAEAYGLWGKRDLFYKYFELAMDLGFVAMISDQDLFFSEEPYASYRQEQRFRAIINEHTLKG